ncbi:MAG: hypothetical protein WCY43_03130 [Patescibacteria group bacterium]|nr:hypothetical protein [Patescibacteria group bacterium]
MKKIEHCCICASPQIEGYKNSKGILVEFEKIGETVLCSDCRDFLNNHDYLNIDYTKSELENFFSENKRILFAYSGGLDSTAVLFNLAKECSLRGIDLKLFTVDTGFKGSKTLENVNNVIDFLGLKSNHFWVDWSKRINKDQRILDSFSSPQKTTDVYKTCWERGELPCGKICNSIMEGAYSEVMKSLGYDVLFTGGDTPKINSAGKYSIFWKDGSILTVRGGYAFNLSKSENDQLIKEKNIPWFNPGCGGYDTDCLIPGSFFSKQFGHSRQTDIETLYGKYPIVFHYLTERVRFKIIKVDSAIKMMTNVDIANFKSYLELLSIVRLLSEESHS